MRLLVIGGTAFLGRATVEEALQRGHHVTTFNRGRTGPDLEGVRTMRGDRSVDADLKQLEGTGFDAVVDTCGFVPRVVGASARALVGSGAHYVFVSSLSAVPDWPQHPVAENAPGHDCPSGAGPDDGDYGVLKAGCERAVIETFGERSTIARAGLILGPHENVGRLPWWLGRIADGGEVLAPGDPAVPMQLVDARDLAAFMLDSAERRTAGTFNATAPRGNATMGSWLGDCVTATGSGATLTWVGDSFLLERGVEPWTELPLWMPPGQGADHAWDVESAAAGEAGLRCRPVTETVEDTWSWLAGGSRPAERRPGLPEQGLAADKERRILADWHTLGLRAAP